VFLLVFLEPTAGSGRGLMPGGGLRSGAREVSRAVWRWWRGSDQSRAW
jgi:hypothetical protein